MVRGDVNEEKKGEIAGYGVCNTGIYEMDSYEYDVRCM